MASGLAREDVRARFAAITAVAGTFGQHDAHRENAILVMCNPSAVAEDQRYSEQVMLDPRFRTARSANLRDRGVGISSWLQERVS